MSETVLFVDDEENILRSFKRLFMDEEIDIMTAASGEKALEIVKDNKDIALIVSDQRMPGMSGAEFLRQTRDILPDTMRMIITGYADINAAVDAINKGGAFRYISKPWKDEELIQIVKDALQRYTLKKENIRLTKIVEKQNEELKKWNSDLELMVTEQTVDIQNKSRELQTLNERLKNNFDNTIIAFSDLLELRDKREGTHSRNVAELSKKAAKEMGLSDKDIETIKVASLLHDIGKIGMPDILIMKDLGNMTVEEENEYRQHPVRGQTAIDSIEDLREAALLVRHHHEYYNGTGFPDKLNGANIPTGSKIIAMSDFIDRIIQRFRPCSDVELALNKVEGELGEKFDPELYPIFKEPTRDVYKDILAKYSATELELSPDDLKEGMIIAKDIRSGTGLLLLKTGIALNESNIQTIKRYYQIDPSESGVFVRIK
ncbi:MAG: HD domain-containing phosphohydrolase [Nitrospirota bacterium]